MNWYKSLKSAALKVHSWDKKGNFWVLPDGSQVDAHEYHAKTGWAHLKTIEPDIDPEEEPSYLEDYEPFSIRGWVRIAHMKNIQLFKNPPIPYPQAKTIAEIVGMFPNDEVTIDFLDDYEYLKNHSRLITNFLTNPIKPKQEKQTQHLQQAIEIPQVSKDETYNELV